MEQIASLLNCDIAKYKDIFNILSKLEEDGEINQISELFYKLFTNESKYTIQELAKIQKEKNERINISKQYEANLSLFFCNLHLVVKHISNNPSSLFSRIIVESTFKVVVKENQEVLKTQNTENKLFDDTEINISQDNQSMKEKERISTMKNSIELSDAQSKVSFKTTNIKTTEKKIVKKESLQNNPSKITSTLQNIINPSSSSRNIKTTISNKESAKIKSIKKSPQSSILSQRSSIQVPFQKPTVNPIKIPVNSEFNYITGSATFSQTERKFWDLNLIGPGPAHYDGNSSISSRFRRSTSPTIGNSPKRTWVEILSQSNPSPGPGGLYPSHHFFAK